MLPERNRLKKRKDFEKVFKEGKSWKESFLLLKTVPNKLKVSRFGFIVGKKYSKKAVLRNKIKRRLREIIRERLPEIKEGLDGVVIVLSEAEKGKEESFEGLKKIINKLFKKAKIYKK